MQTSNDLVDRIRRMGLSPRQQAIQELWVTYCGERWANCAYDWDGTAVAEGLDRTVIETSGVLRGDSAYFTDDLPIKYRRPSAPVHLEKVIVDRFTGLLFGQGMRPAINVLGDEDTDDWLKGLIEASGFWVKMILAKQYGGATGTAPIGFAFRDGKVRFETANPIWLRPKWKDREQHELESLEKLMPFPREEYDAEQKCWKTNWYWYRRVIDAQFDTVFDEVLIPEDGAEVEWKVSPGNRVEHGFGFVPWEWIQNLPDQEDDDGEHDFAGISSLTQSMAHLNSQSHKAIVCNLDPTAVVKQVPPNDFVTLHKGSGSPIRLTVTKEGVESAEYLEASLPALSQVLAFINFDRSAALEIAQCVVDHPDSSNRTATEMRQRMGPMWNKADLQRDMYGPGIERLFTKVLKAARTLKASKPDEMRPELPGAVKQNVIIVPDRAEKDKSGKVIKLVPRKLGDGGVVSVEWPPYVESGPVEQQAVVQNVTSARAGKFLTKRKAIEATASIFRVDDVEAALAELEAEEAARIAGFESDVTKGMDPEDPNADPVDAEDAVDAKAPATGDPAAAPGAGQTIQTTQATVLNGAQISSALDIVRSVVIGDLPRDSGIAMLQAFFNLDPTMAEKVMGSAGTKTPTTPNPEPKGGKPEPSGGGFPFGGGPPKAPPFAKAKPDPEDPSEDGES